MCSHPDKKHKRIFNKGNNIQIKRINTTVKIRRYEGYFESIKMLGETSVVFQLIIVSFQKNRNPRKDDLT